MYPNVLTVCGAEPPSSSNAKVARIEIEKVGEYDTPGDARFVTVEGDYAYVADGESGIQILDINDPSNPVLIGGYDTQGNASDVAVQDGYVYIADGTGGLRVIRLDRMIR